jgi:hypothetical protein
VARQDISVLFGVHAGLHTLPHDTAERREILRLEKVPGEAGTWQRVREYARMARERSQPYLYAAALRDGMQFRIRPRIPRGMPSPGNNERTRHMAQQLSAIADEMLAIDADNAFPHLTKACALFALGQEEKALASFLVAAACSHYDDYVLDWSRVLAPPSLAAEERTLLTAGVLFPHLSCFRETALYLVFLAQQQTKKGNHARAIALREATAEVGRKMRDSRGSLITALVGVAMQKIAWDGRSVSASSEGNRQDDDLLDAASRFAAYARQHGHADLAQKALQEAAISEELRRKAMEYSHQNGVLELGWLQPNQRVMGMRMAGVMLLLWSFAMLFLLGAALVLSPLWKDTETSPDWTASLTSSLIVAGFFVAVAVGGAFVLDGFRSTWEDWLKGSLLEERIPSSLFTDKQFTILHESACAILCLLAAVAFITPLVRVSRATGQSSPAWLITLGILLALSMAASGGTQELGTTGYNMVLVALAVAVAIGGLAGLLASPVYAFVLHKPLPEPFRAAIAALWGLASVVAWKGFLTETALWLAAGLVLWLLWARALPEDTRREMQCAVYRLGMSALILAIFGVWLYALLGYASLPVRAEQHASLDYMMEHGEMSLLERMR